MNNKKSLGFVEIVDQMGSATSIVNSARVSFGKRHNGKLRENDKKLIKYLWAHKHNRLDVFATVLSRRWEP